jgi:hypothetical protein
MPVLFKIFNGLRQQSVCLLLKEEKSALKASQEEYDEMVHRIDETDKEVLSLQSIKKEVRILKKKYADFDTKQGEGSPVSAISTDSSSNGQIEKFLLNGSGMNRWSTDVLKGKCLEMIEAREKQLNQCTQPLLEKVAKIRLETESLKEKISDNGQHYGVVLSNSQYLLCFSRTLLGLPLGAVR